MGVASVDEYDGELEGAGAADAGVLAGAVADLDGAVLADQIEAGRLAEVLVTAFDLVRDTEGSAGELEGIGVVAVLHVGAARGERAVGDYVVSVGGQRDGYSLEVLDLGDGRAEAGGTGASGVRAGRGQAGSADHGDCCGRADQRGDRFAHLCSPFPGVSL